MLLLFRIVYLLFIIIVGSIVLPQVLQVIHAFSEKIFV